MTNKIKITFIEREIFEEKQLKQTIERICYPKNTDELSKTPIGYNAKKIKIECEFDEKDIPKLIDFIENSKPCFYNNL